MYAINLSWEQSNDTLLWAIEDRTHLRITVRLAKEWAEMPSDFLDGEMLKTLTVRRFPAPWTDKMLSGQLLPCSFRRGHRKYLFVSAVISSTQVTIGGRQEEALVLAWPEGIQQVQRRLYFRAAVPAEMTLGVKIWNSVPAIDTTPPSVAPLETGRVIDISAGGSQVELTSNRPLAIDKSYLMEIDMPKPEQPILIQTQVRRSDPAADNQTRYGMQFLSLDHSPRGRDTLMKLARFSNYIRGLQPVRNFENE